MTTNSGSKVDESGPETRENGTGTSSFKEALLAF